MSEENWEPCPRCGSKSVENRPGCLFIAIGSVGLVLIIIHTWGLLTTPMVYLTSLSSELISSVAGILVGIGLVVLCLIGGVAL